jgi:hypothetical protein
MGKKKMEEREGSGKTSKTCSNSSQILLFFSKQFSKFANNIVLLLFKIRKRMEDFLKPYEKNEIEFVPNNFGFDKNMQGDDA